MNNDIKQLRSMLEAHDPAGRVRADPLASSATLREIVGGAERTPGRVTRRWFRRRWLLLLPAAVVLAGAVIALTAVLRPGDVGPVHVGPGKAEALAFTANGDTVDVRIVDPDADPRRYREEFAAHGMDVDLRMQSASPSLVGKMISVSSPGRMTVYNPDGSFDIQDKNGSSRIEGVGGSPDCGVIWCKTGVRIPVALRGPVVITFGRAARPGEPYELAGDPTARGESLEGLPLRNRTVAEVRLMLRQRQVTVKRYYHDAPENPPEAGRGWQPTEHVLRPEEVPGTWYVHEAWGSRDRGAVGLLVAPWPTSVIPPGGS
ncbi:hypothetical protein [Streptosporangium carneum]|uniref:Uncharacterized protein n=1 Tax=Streptosporangium carneum TaxID=47481 RepID=A0A9W6I7Z9_9ACTN|nr:hypothetical protein [Streptosporangium carneum]GLK13772.1 hypothetical protein GCM10017600_71830 [Streptosporangium carneum]